MLNNRYQLGEKLFSEQIGDLFRARDMEHLQHTTPTDVLIHVWPAHSITYTQVAPLQKRLQQQIRQTHEQALLPIIDAGWSGNDAFFVMPAPEAWSFNILPPVQDNTPTSPHYKALKTTQQLVNSGQVREGLEPTFFLVMPDGEIQLLGTALAEELRQWQADSDTLLRPDTRQQTTTRARKAHSWPAWAFTTLAGAAVAASSVGLYYIQSQTPATSDTTRATLPTETSPPSLPKQDSPLLANEQNPMNLSSTAASLNTATHSQAIDDPASLQQLQRANQALSNSRLQTALYFLRLVQHTHANHPQIQNLAQQVAERANEQAKANIAPSDAENLRRLANSVTQEFNLSSLASRTDTVTATTAKTP